MLIQNFQELTWICTIVYL